MALETKKPRDFSSWLVEVFVSTWWKQLLEAVIDSLQKVKRCSIASHLMRGVPGGCVVGFVGC